MDVDYESGDASFPDAPATLALFDLSAEGFPFRAPAPHAIEARRALFSDTLIFDILLTSGGVARPHALYPPADARALARLLDAIEDSRYDRLKRDCLVYFLLKWHTPDDAGGRAHAFVAQRCIPPQFVMLADAYWALDTGRGVERAVSLLSDARLNRDYTSKILQALALSLPAGSTASPSRTLYYAHTVVPNITESAPLLVRYVRTARPQLTEPDDIALYTVALAEAAGITAAWQYQRTFPERADSRTRLVRLLLDWTLTPTPRPTPLRTLLALPLTSYERDLLHAYALRPPAHLSPAARSAARDLAVVRLVHGGAYADAVHLDRQFALAAPPAASGGSVTYAGALQAPEGPRESEPAARARRQLLDELAAVMPAVERAALEGDVSLGLSSGSALSRSARGARALSGSWSWGEQSWASAGSGATVPATNAGAGAGDVSMGESWEDVARPAPASQAQGQGRHGRTAADPPVSRPLSERAGAPRFGSAFGAGSAPLNMNGNTNPAAPAVGGKEALPRAIASVFGVRAAPTAPIVGGLRPRESAGTAGRASLFETVGSANRAPNAFFDPAAGAMTKSNGVPSTKTNGVKRALGQDGPVSAFTNGRGARVVQDDEEEQDEEHTGGDMDVDHHARADHSAIDIDADEADADDGAETDENDEPEPGFEFSVFSNVSGEAHNGTGASHAASARTQRDDRRKSAGERRLRVRTETERMMPPGAYPAPTPEPQLPPAPAPPAKTTRASERTEAISGASAEGPRRRSTRHASLTPSASASPPPQTRAKREVKKTTKARQAADEAERGPAKPATKAKAKGAAASASASAKAKKEPARRGRASEKADLGRSIPGGFTGLAGTTDEEQDEEDEEEDEVPPLPAPAPTRTRAARVVRTHTRSSTGTVSGSEDEDGRLGVGPRVTRRSTRLSHSRAGSADGDDGEGQTISAKTKAPARKTRAPAAKTGSTAKAATRKKR